MRKGIQGPTLVKKDILKAFVKKRPALKALTQKEKSLAYEAFWETIRRLLMAGTSINFVGFGKFYTVERASTGKQVVRFRASYKFRGELRKTRKKAE